MREQERCEREADSAYDRPYLQVAAVHDASYLLRARDQTRERQTAHLQRASHADGPMSPQRKTPKSPTPRGPKPEILKTEGDWKEAVKNRPAKSDLRKAGRNVIKAMHLHCREHFVQ